MGKSKSPSTGMQKLVWLLLILLLGTATFTYGDDDEDIFINAIDEDIFITAADLPSDRIFVPTQLHKVEVKMDRNTLERMRTGQERGWVETEYVIVDDLPPRNHAGIKTHAVRRDRPDDREIFYNHPTLEFDFSRSSEGPLLGLRLLSIRSWSTDDKSLLVQQLAMRLFAEFGLPAPRVAHARVFINGEYLGPYVMEDRVRLDDLVPRYFPLGGNFYKMQNTSLGGGERLTYYDGFAFAQENPDNPDSYIIPAGGYPFQPRGGPDCDPRTPACGSDLLRLIRALNRPTSSQVRAEVGPLLDVNNLINYLAVSMSLPDADGLIAYTDVPAIYFQNNTYFYHNPATDRFNILPDDVKSSLDAYDPNSVNRDLLDGWDTMNITRWLLEEPDLLDRYFRRVRDFITRYYTPERIIPRIEEMARVVRPAIEEDTRRPAGIDMAWWDGRIERLKLYVRNRAANLRRQLPER